MRSLKYNVVNDNTLQIAQIQNQMKPYTVYVYFMSKQGSNVILTLLRLKEDGAWRGGADSGVGLRGMDEN